LVFWLTVLFPQSLFERRNRTKYLQLKMTIFRLLAYIFLSPTTECYMLLYNNNCEYVMSVNPVPPSARFIAARIAELHGIRSQTEIARRAGFKSANVLSMIKDGKTKLPPERVLSVAKALDCEPRKLAEMVVREVVPHDVIQAAFGTVKVKSTTMALKIEVNTMRHELRNARRLLAAVNSKTEKLEARLRSSANAIEEVLEKVGWP
jgi:hypothetical protein